MKRFLVLFLAAVLLFGIVGCTGQTPDPSSDGSGDTSTIPSIDSTETVEVSHSCTDLLREEERGSNYAVLLLKNGKYCYHILSGDEVLYCEKTEQCPAVSAVSDTVLEIRVGYGTGVSASRYYDLAGKVASKWYDDVIFCSGSEILHLEYNPSAVSGSRHSITMTKIFTGDLLRLIQFDDIADTPMPIEDVSLVGLDVQIEYYTPDGTTKIRTIPLPGPLILKTEVQ